MSFYEDEKRIEQFEQIQMNLNSLEPNTDDAKIEELLHQIPENLLNQRENLMIVCELFAIHARNKFITKKRNIFKLFEGIMDKIKTYLSDDSCFFWNIFGGLYFLKLWMYELGLITIETIIMAVNKDTNHAIGEYFLPEIIEKEPEIFDKEIKYHIQCPYSPEYIQEFKEKRKKHLKWICESGEYSDPVFKEIETNPIVYSIAIDDIDSFQKIVSNSNIDINMSIKRSLVLNFHRLYKKQSLLELAFEFNAIKITKFLIMNNVKFDNNLYFSAICSNNYEIIHLVESKLPEEFVDNMIYFSISVWNDDVTEYLLNEYDDSLGFLDESDVEIENTKIIYDIIESTMNYLNFNFLRTYLVPFFRKNKCFIDKNINEIVNLSFYEKSGFFTKEFMKNPNFDVNFYSETKCYSILGNAIDDEALIGVEILMKNPDLDINKFAFNKFPPLTVAIGNLCDMKILKLICEHPKIDVNLRDGRYNVNSFEISVSKGNFYALRYLVDNFPNLETESYMFLFYFALKIRSLKTLEILLEFYLSHDDASMTYDEIINHLKSYQNDVDYREEYLDDFRKIYNELKNNK